MRKKAVLPLGVLGLVAAAGTGYQPRSRVGRLLHRRSL